MLGRCIFSSLHFFSCPGAYDGGMSGVDVKTMVKQVEELLARAGALPVEAEQAIEKLLNVVEALSADKKELTEEVQRLRKLLEQKKQAKTTAEAPQARNSRHQTTRIIPLRSDDENETRNATARETAVRSRT